MLKANLATLSFWPRLLQVLINTTILKPAAKISSPKWRL
jgi:flagellar biosynthesis protein FliQ